MDIHWLRWPRRTGFAAAGRRVMVPGPVAPAPGQQAPSTSEASAEQSSVFVNMNVQTEEEKKAPVRHGPRPWRTGPRSLESQPEDGLCVG